MKTKPIHELLEIMLDNKDLFVCGLCGWTYALYFSHLIDSKETSLLLDYIDNNRPFNLRTIFRKNFYWKRGKLDPRIKWLKKHIELTKT